MNNNSPNDLSTIDTIHQAISQFMDNNPTPKQIDELHYCLSDIINELDNLTNISRLDSDQDDYNTLNPYL